MSDRYSLVRGRNKSPPGQTPRSGGNDQEDGGQGAGTHKAEWSRVAIATRGEAGENAPLTRSEQEGEEGILAENTR